MAELDATGLTRPSVNPAAIEVQQKAAEAIAELITMLVRFRQGEPVVGRPHRTDIQGRSRFGNSGPMVPVTRETVGDGS